MDSRLTYPESRSIPVVIARIWLLFVVIMYGFAPCAAARDVEKRPAETAVIPSQAAPAGLMPEYVHGLFLSMKGDFWGAIDSFRKVAAARPNEAAVHYSLSQAYFGLAVPDSARVHGEAAVKLDPGNTYYARYLARLSHEMQNFDRAAELYGQVSLAEPERTDIIYLQALEYLAAGKPEQALEAFSKVLRIDALNEEALSQSLLLQISLKRYDEAIVSLRQLLKKGGANESTIQLTLGDLYVLTGQGELALDTFRAMIAADPDYVPAWVSMFDYFIKGGRQADYLRELNTFLDLRRSSADTEIEVAKLYLVRAEKDSLYVEPSSRLVDGIISRHPRESRIYMLKGIYEMRHDRGRDALSTFRKALAIDGGNLVALEYMITTHLDLDENRKAFDLLAKAKSRHPRHMPKWKTIEGYALLHTGSPKRATAILETVVRVKSDKSNQDLLVQANTTLAMAYDALGRKKSCREAYARVLELDAHNTLAMNNLAYLLAEEGTKMSRALRLAENAVMLEPENGVYLDTLGWVHYRMGNYDLARQMLEKAVATGVVESEIFQHLGLAYEKLGNEQKAEEMFERSKVEKAKATKQ
ncbi:MAG: tetratricopeptide repeat protein [Chlorobiaceae bacterium]|nr:tetratricopeptide repeat protein [Chlorobiaceae bacterium]